MPIDVTDDGFITSLDALRVINDLNLNGSRSISTPFDNHSAAAVYFDVSGDSFITPIDALLVINRLNLNPSTRDVRLQLATDSGISSSDKLTNDAHLLGQVAIGAGAIATAKARLNRGNVFDVSVDNEGHFSIDPTAIQSILDGEIQVTVYVIDTSGVDGLRQLQFKLDTSPPSYSSPRIIATDDTGRHNNDNITQITQPRLTGLAEAGSRLRLQVDGITLFDDISPGEFQVQTSASTDGMHEIVTSVSDDAGNLVNDTIPFVIDTQNPGAPSLDLAPTSDTGVLGDRSTRDARVTLVGATEGNSFVTVADSNVTVRSSSDGTFRIPNISLLVGDNSFALSVTDLAGNSTIGQQSIIRTNEAAVIDPALRWNAAVLNAIRMDATPPPMATRALAMMSVAMLDVINAIDHSPAYLISFAAPPAIALEAAVSASAHQVLSYLYPGQATAIQAVHDAVLSGIAEGSAKADGIAFGTLVGDAVIALRSRDGWDTFVDSSSDTAPGAWQQTAPMFANALLPQWGALTPFGIADVNALMPDGPPALSSQEWADAYNEVKLLGRATGSTRTAQQTEIARFWADGGGTYTPPGHWNQIAAQFATERGLSLGEKARLFAMLNVALGDAAIVTWDTKYSTDFWRPITAIQNGDSDGNNATAADGNWTSLLITPNFPEYISGHSTFSGAAAEVLTRYFGDNQSFSTTSLGLPGVTRSFTSFNQAAAEAGQSRIYGGIHYQFSNQDGLATGSAVADEVMARFAVNDDTQAPNIVFISPPSGKATTSNATIEGWAIDNLAGVAKVTLQTDGGTSSPVVTNANGRFALATTFLLDGTHDGPHTLRFTAVDSAGNISKTDFTFTLDTKAPTLSMTSPLAIPAPLGSAPQLAGTVNGTGTTINAFSYQLDSGVVMPISFAADGSFNQPLDIARLSLGSHSLRLRFQDAAGNVMTSDITISVSELAPFKVSSVTPSNGSADVGSNFRPEVFFTRPVDPSTLNTNSFYATDPAGQRLLANVVPTSDGTAAWLFLTNPMPSASTITLHVDGSIVKAAGDSTPLDGNSDGIPGGMFESTFSTVNLTPLPGTSLSGRILSPGPDLRPMTWDDFRAGPDQTPFTADDVFLNPLAGVKLWILGLENSPVFTAADGTFKFLTVPAGTIKVAMDGRTATDAPAGYFFPEMVMDLEIEAGYDNTMMGSMGTREVKAVHENRAEVYLPLLVSSILTSISDSQPTTVGVTGLSAPNLSPEQRSQLKLFIPPGAILDANGQPLADPQVGISMVPPEFVRDMLPPDLRDSHTMEITIQAPGASVFAEPIAISLPNLSGALPGTTLQVLSFDHTTGLVIPDGTATVSADGLFAISNPGSGIRAPGWHFIDRFVTVEGSPILENDETANTCDPLYLTLKALMLRDVATGLGRLPGTGSYAGDHLFHFLDGDGLPFPYSDGSGPAIDIQNSEPFLLEKALIEAGLKTKISDAFQSNPSNPHVSDYVTQTGPMTFYSDIPNQLVAGFGIVNGASVKVSNIKINPDGTYNANIQYSIVDDYQFDPNDASKSPFDRFARDLQLCSFAKPFSTEVVFTQASSGGVQSGQNASVKRQQPSMLWYSFSRPIEVHLNGLNLTVDPIGNVVFSRATPLSIGRQVFAVSRAGSNGASIRGNSGSDGSGFVVRLRAHTTYRAVVLNTETLRDGSVGFTTGGPGSFLRLGAIVVTRSTEIDSDEDGLSDAAEDVVGTSAIRRDTDGDGITDRSAVLQGLDPLGGRGISNGLIGSLAIQGQANQVLVERNSMTSGGQTAFIAGTMGLVIVDATQFNRPILLSQLALAGEAASVGMDPTSHTVVVASGVGGLHFVDVVDPLKPKLLRTANIQAVLADVIDGVAYTAVGSQILSYEALTGELFSTLNVPNGASITGMTHEGGVLYTMDASRFLRAFEATDAGLVARGSLQMTHGGGKISVSNGVIYAAASPSFGQGGFATANVSDPNNLVEISASDIPAGFAAPGDVVVPNGSGLALVGGKIDFGPPAVDLVDVRDPSDTANLVTQFTLPVTPKSIAIASGIAYVADGSGGLQVINYVGFDTQGKAPTVRITGPSGEIIQEGTVVPIRVTANDDVQVRNVELLMNGVVVANDVSAPFDLSAVVPSLASDLENVSFQVRATDTGGNVGLSNVLNYRLSTDVTPPRLASSSPADEGAGFRLRTIALRFNEPIDSTRLPIGGMTLTNLGADFKLGGNDDTVIPLRDIQSLTPRRLAIRTVDVLPEGRYQFSIDPSILADVSGNEIAAPITLRFTSFNLDEENAVAWISDTDGDWNNPDNWSTGNVPGPNDAVVIDRKTTNPIIRISSGNIQIKSLIAREHFIISGASLTITESSEIQARFEMANGSSLTVSGANALFIANGETKIEGASLIALGGAQIILRHATSYDGLAGDSEHDPRTIKAEGAGSRIDLSGVTSFRGRTRFASGVSIHAKNGGVIDMSNVGQISGGATGLTADGSGSVIDISKAATVVTGQGTVEALNLGRIRMASATELDGGGRGLLQVIANGVIEMSSIVSLKGVDLRLDEQGTLPTAQLTSVTNSGVTISRVAINLGSVTSMQGSVLTLRSGGTVNLSQVTNIDGMTFDVSGGVVLALPAARSYDGLAGDSEHDPRTIRADGAGSRIDLSGLTTFRGRTRFASGVSIQAKNGGVIDMSNIGQITGGATSLTADGSGSVIDISKAATVVTGQGTVEALNLGRIRMASATELDGGGRGLLQVIANGVIEMSSIVSLKGVDLRLDEQGTLPTAQLTSVTNSGVTISRVAINLGSVTSMQGSVLTLRSGGTVNLSQVTNIDGMTFDVSGGVVLALPAARSYDGLAGDSEHDPRTIRADGAGSRIDLSGLTTFRGRTRFASGVSIHAKNGGVINMSNVGQISGGATGLTADGSGSVIDLSSAVAIDTGGGPIEELNSGRILRP